MRFGVVVPWCGVDMNGGVERHALSIAMELGELGYSSEVLTTTGRSSFTAWDEDYFEEGIEECAWGRIRRFPLEKRNGGLYDVLFTRLRSSGTLPWLEEQQLLLQKVSSRSLYEYISTQSADYVVIGMPYYYGLVHWAIKSAPGVSVLIPCLHDEPEAYMSATRELFTFATHAVFNSDPELALARGIIPQGSRMRGVIGVPVSDTRGMGVAQRFRAKFGIEDPFLLYVGRKVSGKGLDHLLSMIQGARSELPEGLRLVTIGPGSMDALAGQDTLGDMVVDLGELPDSDKLDAMAAATALCHFSKLESFSLVLMESWYQSTPVIVHEQAKVLASHVRASGGGWIVDTIQDFSAAVTQALLDRGQAEQTGLLGLRYAERFTDKNVTRRLIEVVRS